MQRWPTGARAAPKRCRECRPTGPRGGGRGGQGRARRRGPKPRVGWRSGTPRRASPRDRGGGEGGAAGPLLTWLSSFSAAIRSFGSMVPFSAWMIRLRSISPGGGSAAPGPVGQTAALVFLLTLSASCSATPRLPHSPAPATVATCSHLLRHSDSAPPVLPFYPPQLALHSPFYDSRWEAGEGRRGSGASFTAPSSPGRDPWPLPSAAPMLLYEKPQRPLSWREGSARPRQAAAMLPYGTPSPQASQMRKPAGSLSLHSCFVIKRVEMERHFFLVRKLFGHHN